MERLSVRLTDKDVPRARRTRCGARDRQHEGYAATARGGTPGPQYDFAPGHGAGPSRREIATVARALRDSGDEDTLALMDLSTLARAREAASKHLHSLPNVQSVGAGYEEVGGQVTGQLCLRVYVTAKLPPSQLDPKERIPDQIDGIPTDVIKKYPDRLADDVTGPNVFETRPVACGVQITRSGFLGAHQ
jgi:hypothetical protein